jgi:hypothetical protein
MVGPPLTALAVARNAECAAWSAWTGVQPSTSPLFHPSDDCPSEAIVVLERSLTGGIRSPASRRPACAFPVQAQHCLWAAWPLVLPWIDPFFPPSFDARHGGGENPAPSGEMFGSVAGRREGNWG